MIKIFVLFLVIISKNSFSESIGSSVKDLGNTFYTFGSSSLEKVIDSFGGEGETEVSVTAGEDMKPYGYVSITREISKKDNSIFFHQTQINNYQIRSKDRQALNFGLGYRILSDNKSFFYGGNVFFDVDTEANTRTSIGAELKATPFSLTANRYIKISGANTVGSFTERTLDGYDLILTGQVPFMPWANINFTSYQWDKIKNSKDSKGNKISGEFIVTKNIIFEMGVDDNDISGSDDFFILSYVWPGIEKQSLVDGIIEKEAFKDSNVENQMLTKIRRNNRIVLEVEGAGVTISRLD